jgi:hypothetical protein
MLSFVTKGLQLTQQLTSAVAQLEKVWSGQASESAVKKLTDSIKSFEQIVKVVENGAKLLHISGTLVQTAQTGHNAVVTAVNPTTGALMSNPWTYSAGVAVGRSGSTVLQVFVQSIQTMLNAIGGVQMLQEIMQLLQIIQQIEKLFNSATPATGAASTVTSTPISMPVTPPQVASQTGQQLLNTPVPTPTLPTGTGTGTNGTSGITNYTPPALAGQGSQQGTGFQNIPYPANNSGPGNQGNQGSQGSWPINDPGNTWIPVNPPATGTGTGAGTGTGTTAQGGNDVTVSVTENGVTHTVSAPAGTPTNVSFDLTNAAGQHSTESIAIDANGSVNVSG